MNKRTILILTITVVILFLGLASRNGDIVWMSVPFLVYLGVGIALAPVKEEIRLKARRSVSVTEKGSPAVIEVEVTVSNTGRKMLSLCVCDPLLEGMSKREGYLSLHEILKPEEETTLKYTFTSLRGCFSWQFVDIMISDPFGLFEVAVKPEAAAKIYIQPRLKKIRPIALHLQRTLSSPGSVSTRMGGSGTEFFGVRDYHPGDPLKSLDWRLTARHPHKYFTREFIQEKTADIMLILDARRKTELRIGTESLFEHEINAAASLAEMFIRQGQRLGLFIFGDTPVCQLPDYGKIQLNRILNCLAEAKIETEENHNCITIPVRIFSRLTLLVIINPVDSRDKDFYLQLKARGHRVLLISPDTLDFARPILRQDEFSLLALKASWIERRLSLGAIAHHSISIIDWKLDQPLLPLVRHALGRPMRVWKE
jgi:uncharacterized protein (DUF58 family)